MLKTIKKKTSKVLKGKKESEDLKEVNHSATQTDEEEPVVEEESVPGDEAAEAPAEETPEEETAEDAAADDAYNCCAMPQIPGITA